MSKAFISSYAALPAHIKSTLGSWGIPPDLTGASFLKEMFTSTEDTKQFIRDVQACYPEGSQSDKVSKADLRRSIVVHLKPLAIAAGCSHKVSDIPRWEQDELEKAQTSRATSVPVLDIPQHLLRKWRRITPAKITTLEPTTMRALELKLKEQWSMRLSQLLVPYADDMPEVKKRLAFADPMREVCDLFGKSRWGGIKGHVTDIERAIRIMPSILPPTEEKGTSFG